MTSPRLAAPSPCAGGLLLSVTGAIHAIGELERTSTTRAPGAVTENVGTKVEVIECP